MCYTRPLGSVYYAVMEPDVHERVGLIREVFEYLDRFTNRTFVVKIDGDLVEHQSFAVLARDVSLLHRLGIHMVLVPGARSRIDEVLRRYHVPCRTVRGIRVSTPEALPFIKMAAFDVSNRLLTRLSQNGVYGVIGNWVRARSMGVVDGVDYRHTGVVEGIHTESVKAALEHRMVPIFPNIGWSSVGRPYNISSTEAASQIAQSLQASKVLYVLPRAALAECRLPFPEGVLRTPAGLAGQIPVGEAERAAAGSGEDQDGELLSVLRAACRACRSGVERVHLVNGEQEGVVLSEVFSSRGVGLMIYANQHENIRAMQAADVPEVIRIMQPLVEQHVLVGRSEEKILERLGDYVVYEVDGIVHGCGALFAHGASQGEIAAIAVDGTYRGMGIGRRIVTFLVDRARRLGLRELFLLTTQTADWFLQLGFREAAVHVLPEEKRREYSLRRNSRVLVRSLE